MRLFCVFLPKQSNAAYLSCAAFLMYFIIIEYRRSLVGGTQHTGLLTGFRCSSSGYGSIHTGNGIIVLIVNVISTVRYSLFTVL